jgi:hypothetical protein
VRRKRAAVGFTCSTLYGVPMGLEANLRVLDFGWSKQAEVALEGRVAALVAVLVAELRMEVGAPAAWTDAQAAPTWIRWTSMSSVGLARP